MLEELELIEQFLKATKIQFIPFHRENLFKRLKEGGKWADDRILPHQPMLHWIRISHVKTIFAVL